MNTKILLSLIILFVVVIYSLTSGIEGFATSPGTLIQLAAKGAQDSYLTGIPRYPYEWQGHITGLPFYNWRGPFWKSNPYYFYSRYPPTWIGGRPIYGRPFYERPYYYTPLGQYWR